MILLLKYIDDQPIYDINPVEYDHIETNRQNDIQKYGYSYYTSILSGILYTELYVDTDSLTMVEHIFPDECEDVKQWMKLQNRSNTIKQILNGENNR
jgi:hypothetical protein